MLPPTEYWLTVGLGKPGMPKAARLMRVRSAEALNDPVGVLVSAWAAARACSRVASAAAKGWRGRGGVAGHGVARRLRRGGGGEVRADRGAGAQQERRGRGSRQQAGSIPSRHVGDPVSAPSWAFSSGAAGGRPGR